MCSSSTLMNKGDSVPGLKEGNKQESPACWAWKELVLRGGGAGVHHHIPTFLVSSWAWLAGPQPCSLLMERQPTIKWSSEPNEFSAAWSGLATMGGKVSGSTCLQTLPHGPAPPPAPSLCILLICFLEGRHRQQLSMVLSRTIDTTHLPSQVV